jgi:hypothetical protein
LRHGVGIFEDQALQLREVEIRSIVAEVGDLFGGDSGFSADGRADVNSKRASDEGCDAKFGQAFQFVIDAVAAHLGLLHLKISPENFAVMRRDLYRHDDSSEAALG